MKGVHSNREYELPLNAVFGFKPSAYRRLNGQTKDNSYHINGRIIESSNGVNGHRSQIPFAFSSARSHPLASAARSRLPDRARSTSPAGCRPSVHLVSRSASFHIRPPLHLIWSPARFAASVSAHARLFSVCFSASPPDPHTDAEASPCRAHLICAPLSRDVDTTITRSAHRFHHTAVSLPHHHRAAQLRARQCVVATAIFAGA
jgi:hypothetical protein